MHERRAVWCGLGKRASATKWPCFRDLLRYACAGLGAYITTWVRTVGRGASGGGHILQLVLRYRRRTRPRICIHIRRYSSRPPLDCIWRYTRARTRSARTPPWVPLRHCRIQTHKMGSREVLTVPHILFPWRTNRIDIAFTLAPGINSVNTLGKNVTLC